MNVTKGCISFEEKLKVNQEKKTEKSINFLTSYSHSVVDKFFNIFGLPKQKKMQPHRES
tara:strand:+ start:618 stop:794 length:177 start_codon:yes stop_codon:yes gene_type:complete